MFCRLSFTYSRFVVPDPPSNPVNPAAMTSEQRLSVVLSAGRCRKERPCQRKVLQFQPEPLLTYYLCPPAASGYTSDGSEVEQARVGNRRTRGSPRLSGAVQSPPMHRRLFTILSALSLVVCAATATIGGRSYEVCNSANLTNAWMDQGEFHRIDWIYVSSQGGLGISHSNIHISATETAVELPHGYSLPWGVLFRNSIYGAQNIMYPNAPVAGKLHCLGFIFNITRFTRSMGSLDRWCSGSSWAITVPYWSMAALTAIAPFQWFRRSSRTRQRVRSGSCVNCGYNIRATPDRCPECGSVQKQTVAPTLHSAFSP